MADASDPVEVQIAALEGQVRLLTARTENLAKINTAIWGNVEPLIAQVHALREMVVGREEEFQRRVTDATARLKKGQSMAELEERMRQIVDRAATGGDETA